MIDGWGISCGIALIWMPLDFTDDQSTLVQVMAWCHRATSHYVSQCWPRSLSPYGVTRGQWVNTLRLRQNGRPIPDHIFNCMKMKKNPLRFHWRLFPRVQFTIFQHWSFIGSDNGLAPRWRQAIIWTNDGQGWWCIYASLDLNELTHWSLGDGTVISD